MNTQKIAIIGYGELGKAIHKLLKNKSDLIVDIWDKKYHESKLSGVISSANIIFICVPSWCVRGALESIKKYLSKKALVVCLAKGIEPAPHSGGKDKTLKTMDVVLQDELSVDQPFSILSGSMLAEELMADKNGFAVVASKNKKDFFIISDVFNKTNLKVKYSKDLRGIALCGVLKNIYALGLGIIDGLELGGNSKGKFLAMAIIEMIEIVKYLGGNDKTVLSVAGIGDLIATGFSKYSRNREAGEELAKTGICCLESEGFKSVNSMAKLLGKKADKLPFFNILKSIILENQKPKDVFSARGGSFFGEKNIL
ncbi:MAG: NAD(P)H-dependent glycerol-3-phosphate dehydrogenase [Patescibacteria group bacterium]